MRQSILALIFIAFAVVLNAQTTPQYPFQNPDLSIDERVQDLISRMTIEEKAMQLFHEAPAIERLGVPAYNWWNECLHGVARAGKATVFPQAIGLAATFDEKLMNDVGNAISDEGRAKHHYFARNNARGIYMGLTYWTPNINIFRDPRWGRGQETYGEDPFLTGRMAVNFIKGIQGNHPTYLKAIATAKHYAVHSGPEFTRHSDNVFVNDRDLYETYLPAFRAAVKEANVQSVMCAYNRLRDKPCCGSDMLLSNILRREFGFRGYVVSDCGAITDFYNADAHHVVNTPEEAWGWSLATGTDLNCEMTRAFVKDHLKEAVERGILNEKDMNLSLTRLFRARFLLGMFDPPSRVPFTSTPMSVVGSEGHLNLAEAAAEKSLVLLKNNGLLPLSLGKKVAVIGPNANNFSVIIGNYNGVPIRPVTPLHGLQQKLGKENVFYAQGCAIVPGMYADVRPVPAARFFHEEKGTLKKGLQARYYVGASTSATPDLIRIDTAIDFFWERTPIHKLVDESFTVIWSGVFVPDHSGTFRFDGNVKLRLNGEEAMDREVKLEKDKRYTFEASLVVEPFWWSSNVQQQYAGLSWVETSVDYEQEALNAALLADVIVFCGGISPNLEGEEMKLNIDGFAHGDRTHINLPMIQEELLKKIHQTGKPIVYVNFSGSAIAMNWEKENLPAIVQAFYPGEATGIALAKMLFGDFNPSGRLPVTFYKSIDDLPEFNDYRMAGRTYRYFKGEPLFPFGYGLSYTTFTYSNLKINQTASTNSDVSLSVDVTNSGQRDGEEVVEVYVSLLGKNVPVPERSLASIQRVWLMKGETKTVSITLSNERFSFINDQYKRVVGSGACRISVGGGQPSPLTEANGTTMERQIMLQGEVIVIK